MIDIRTIDNLTLSQFCHHLRTFFINKNFEEIVLFDTSVYEVASTNQIRTETGDYLRATTEPDIWETGLKYDKFFCITSLFRNEQLNSLFHKREFKVLDFYIKNSTEKEILTLLFDCLSYLENQLNTPSLSDINISRCTFEAAQNINYHQYTNQILQIVQYPIEESFYDDIDQSTGKTKKGEFFYIHDATPIEFGVYGQVGDNKNHTQRITNFKFDHENICSLNIYGACIGIERLITCYQILKTSEVALRD